MVAEYRGPGLSDEQLADLAKELAELKRRVKEDEAKLVWELEQIPRGELIDRYLSLAARLSGLMNSCSSLRFERDSALRKLAEKGLK